MKKTRIKNTFLEQLRKVPIIQVACEKVDISRNSIYRWRKGDKKFCKQMDEALSDGEALINDMSENQLISLIMDKNFPAVSFWLKHRNSKFRDRVEVTNINTNPEKLSPKQEALVREALKLVIRPEQQTK